MKKIGIFFIVLIIIGAVMFATNPTQEDFAKFLEKQASRNIEKYAEGSEKLAESMLNSNKALPGNYSKSQYERSNYYVLSVYETDADVLNYSKKYLGIFKLFFKSE